MRRLSFIVAFLLVVAGAAAADAPPSIITNFCAMHFPQGIAAMGEPFNATDVVEQGKSSRRILAYSIAGSTSFLLYEHGGRGYHQHLVQFDTIKPETISASYVFIKSPHKSIVELIGDLKFLAAHLASGAEL